MKKLISNKEYAGIVWAIAIASVFVALSFFGLQFFSGTPWFIFSSVTRFLFGFIILFVIKKVYGKPVKEVLSLKGSKQALAAGMGFVIYFVYFLIAWWVGIDSITGLTTGLLISRIILQQLATAFYEELNYRVLILEGYFYGPQNARSKLLYSFISFLLFGAIHVLTGWDTYKFIMTGTIGFAYAVIYLKTRNAFIPMAFHFVYDIFANLSGYIAWNHSPLFDAMQSYTAFYIVIFIMFAVSVAILLRKEKNDKDHVTLP